MSAIGEVIASLTATLDRLRTAEAGAAAAGGAVDQAQDRLHLPGPGQRPVPLAGHRAGHAPGSGRGKTSRCAARWNGRTTAPTSSPTRDIGCTRTPPRPTLPTPGPGQ